MLPLICFFYLCLHVHHEHNMPFHLRWHISISTKSAPFCSRWKCLLQVILLPVVCTNHGCNHIYISIWVYAILILLFFLLNLDDCFILLFWVLNILADIHYFLFPQSLALLRIFAFREWYNRKSFVLFVQFVKKTTLMKNEQATVVCQSWQFLQIPTVLTRPTTWLIFCLCFGNKQPTRTSTFLSNLQQFPQIIFVDSFCKYQQSSIETKRWNEKHKKSRTTKQKKTATKHTSHINLSIHRNEHMNFST